MVGAMDGFGDGALDAVGEMVGTELGMQLILNSFSLLM